MRSIVGVFVRERERKEERRQGRVCAAVERTRNQYSVCTDGDSVGAGIITGLRTI